MRNLGFVGFRSFLSTPSRIPLRLPLNLPAALFCRLESVYLKVPLPAVVRAQIKKVICIKLVAVKSGSPRKVGKNAV